MTNDAKLTSFVINKAITTSKLFSQIDISASAKLVLRCLVDYWNYKSCCAYPTQSTIMDCTGLSQPSVINSIKELLSCGLIDVDRKYKRNYYNFTLKFFRYLKLTDKLSPKNFLGYTLKNLSNIPKNSLGNNILKEKEKTKKENFFKSSFLENRHRGKSEDLPMKISDFMFLGDNTGVNVSQPEENLQGGSNEAGVNVSQPKEKLQGGSNETGVNTQPEENLQDGYLGTNSDSLEGGLPDDSSDEFENIDPDLGRAIAIIRHLGHNPIFKEKVEELKKEFNLDDNGVPIPKYFSDE